MTLPVLVGLLPDGEPDPAVAQRVAGSWLAGGLVGLPTETVYGLAADAQDPEAVARIYRAKGRPADHPVIVHVAGPAAIRGWCAGDDAVAQRLAQAFWPGPLTVVVRRSARAGDFITGGQDTVALRCPAHPVARACIAALATASGDPARGVAAPSANRFGRVSPTRAADVVAELGERLDPASDLVVDGGPSAVGVESTIVDCTVDPPRVLRLGAISQAQVDAVLATPAPPPRDDPFRLSTHEGPQGAWIIGGEGAGAAPAGKGDGAQPGAATVSHSAEPAAVRAPGTLDSHYAPHAQVLLVRIERVPAPNLLESGMSAPAHREPGMPTPSPAESGDLAAFLRDEASRSWSGGPGEPPSGAIGLIAPAPVPTPSGWARLSAPASAEAYARELYAALRRADELGLAVVVAVLPERSAGPLAEAVRDRLTRAAHPA